MHDGAYQKWDLRQRGDGNVNGSCGYHGVNTGMTEHFEGISQG
jgi:hypothetical protein